MHMLGADLLSVRTANASANKMDVHLRRTIVHDASIDPATGALSATTEVVLRNDAPDTLADYAAGEIEPGLPRGSNRQLVSLYTPHLLDTVRVDGRPALVESQPELGWNVYSLYVVVRPGEAVTVTFELSGTATVDAYRLRWDAQPLHNTDDLTIRVRTGDATLVSSDGPTRRDLDLTTDPARGTAP